MTALIPALAGGLVALGLLGLVIGLRPAAVPPRQSTRARRRRGPTRRTRLLLLAGGALGLVGWLITGWILALVIAPIAVIGLPILLVAPPAATQIARLEAMEEWTRSLSGVLTVGIGLEQALVATLRSTPAPIAAEVTRLVARLRARWDTEDGAARIRRRTRRRHRRPDRSEPDPRRPSPRSRAGERARRTR